MWLSFVEPGGFHVGAIGDWSNGSSGSWNDVLIFLILIMEMMLIFEE